MDFEFWQEKREEGLFGGKAPAPDAEDSEIPLALTDTQSDEEAMKGKPLINQNEAVLGQSEGDFNK